MCSARCDDDTLLGPVALADGRNCGVCGNVCPVPGSCIGGRCQCRDGYAVCAEVCVDLRSDRAHCGACGRVCAEGDRCVDGESGCVNPTGAPGDINGDGFDDVVVGAPTVSEVRGLYGAAMMPLTRAIVRHGAEGSRLGESVL